MNSQVKVVEHYVLNLKDDVDLARITGINVSKIRLLGVNHVAPVNLLGIRDGDGNAGHADHLIKPCVDERLDTSVGHELTGHLLATCCEKVDSVGLVMDSAHAAYLRCATLVHGCQGKRPGKLHLFEASLSIHYESLPSDCLLSVRSAASGATGRSGLGVGGTASRSSGRVSRAAGRSGSRIGRAASSTASRCGLGVSRAASGRRIGSTARGESGDVLKILGHGISFRTRMAGRSHPVFDALCVYMHHAKSAQRPKEGTNLLASHQKVSSIHKRQRLR